MHTRPVTRDDVPDLVTIFCDAFINNELFAYLAPYRHDYPLAWRFWAWQKILFQLNTPGRYGFVCVSDELDDFEEPGKVLGYSWWFRMLPKNSEPSADPYMQNNRSIGTTVDRLLRKVEEKYRELVCPLPILSPSTDYVVNQTLHSSDLFTPIAHTPSWHLSALAVSPKYQRKGVGNLLLEWGLLRAREESEAHPDRPPIPVRLHASPSGRGLYYKNGFRIIGWKSDLAEAWIKEMNASDKQVLKDVYLKASGPELDKGGGCGMLHDPKGFWTQEPDGEVLSEGLPVERVWTDYALESSQAAASATASV